MPLGALNVADVLIVCDGGYELLAEAGALFHAALSKPGVIAVTGPVRIETPDGVQASTWTPTALDATAVVADPRGVPPVWAVRRTAGRPAADLDGPLGLADAWLDVLTSLDAGRIVVLDRHVARFDVTRTTRWERLTTSAAYAAEYRAFLERHVDLVQRQIGELMIVREMAFGRLRDHHLRLVARRDEEQRELDAVRAQAAHHRAYLAHHGFSADAIEWGSFDRADPVARDWGYARGGPVDRRYIRQFVAGCSSDVRGRVLEVQEPDLTEFAGGPRVTRSDVLDVDPRNVRATVVADLRHAAAIADAAHDCIILTQTAHVIDDMPAVVRECHRILAPGGVLLATFPSVSRVCLEYGPNGDFWRVTPAGARALVSTVFDDVSVEAFGNVKTTMAFLHGLGEQELTDADYAVTDPYNPMLVGIRARKAAPPAARTRGVVLLYHRIASDSSNLFDLAVPPRLFEEQLAWLREHASIVPLESLLERAPDDLPANAVAITFDDGYVEHGTEVAPMLAGRGIPATFFVTSAGLEADAEHWWDWLERVAADRAAELHDRLVHAPLDERRRLMRAVDDRHAVNAPRRRLMRAAEVVALAAVPGMTIGAHGVHHLYLPSQTAEARLEEMRGSRAALEAVVGRPVTLFAYPYGGVDAPTADMARREFRFTVSCAGTAVREPFDAAMVPRLDVKAWSMRELAARIDQARRLESPPGIRFLP